MTVLAWPCRDKKNPLSDVEEELMMEAWHLLKNEEEPHSQKDRKDEKAEGYVPDEGTR